MFGRGQNSGRKERKDGAAPALAAASSPPAGAPIPGLMQDHPINLVAMLRHGAIVHPSQEIVSALAEGGVHRQTYAETYARAQRLANALKRLGVGAGDRVATLAWNTHRHVEAWYAISGQGAICHTVNPRLAPEQIAYIIDHADNRVLLADLTFLPLVRAMRGNIPQVERVIVMVGREHMPTNGPQDEDWLCYEELVAAEEPVFDWPSFPEETASSLCYTSGTTGDPKGVLYSHRSNMLHAFAITSKDVQNLGADDVSLMIVPMFHANAWGLVYGAPMVGAKMVLPGPALDGPSVHRLIKDEGVTRSAAVPTVWNMLLAHVEKEGEDLAPLEQVIIGASAPAPAMIRTLIEKYKVRVVHGWGMTETSPVGTVNRLRARDERLPMDEQIALISKQGRPLFGVELRIVDETGQDLPRDGAHSGHLLVRGPWVAKRYFKRDDVVVDADGWFDTGDVATIDAAGVMQITDRAKDVIKSGGEWISSVDLENCAMGARGVQLACAVGVRHPKWEERPILLVVAKEGERPEREAILEHLAQTCAKWQLPDDIIFVDELPLTAAGKFDKKVVRAQYADHLMNAADA